MKLDEIDIRLLGYLQEDSRANINDLSKALNLTKTPIYERIKRYEKEGLIEKFVAVLNKDLIQGMVVFCSVSLDSQKLSLIESFREDVRELEEVIECYLMGGANDFLLKVMVRDLNHYHEFSSGKLAAIPNVREIKSMFVLNTVKHTTKLPIY